MPHAVFHERLNRVTCQKSTMNYRALSGIKTRSMVSQERSKDICIFYEWSAKKKILWGPRVDEKTKNGSQIFIALFTETLI
jgi:hypothetical protein